MFSCSHFLFCLGHCCVCTYATPYCSLDFIVTYCWSCLHLLLTLDIIFQKLILDQICKNLKQAKYGLEDNTGNNYKNNLVKAYCRLKSALWLPIFHVRLIVTLPDFNRIHVK